MSELSDKTIIILVALCLFCLGSCGVGACAVGPQYKVYSSRLEGEARLAEADSSRRIAVREAEAKRDSAKMLAEAEIARAKGVAEANTIIGRSLQGNESYLHYLWIQNLHEGKSDVIYVPTEANLPIMEAGRRRSAEREAEMSEVKP